MSVARPRKPRSPAPDRRGAELWLGHLLNRSAALLRERVGEALRSFDITPRAFGLLVEVSRREGHAQVELARRLGFDRTTMSQLVEELRSQGWIEREAHEEDRRVNTLCLTARGEKRLRDAIVAADAIEADFASCLDPEAVTQLRRSLQRVLDHARDSHVTPPRSIRKRR